MPELRSWRELPAGGAVVPGESAAAENGRLAHGLEARGRHGGCVNCLLCWLYCPDSAIRLDGTTFAGIDLDICKGCELCATVCPVGSIRMVPDDR